jgi:hypothetical protein
VERFYLLASQGKQFKSCGDNNPPTIKPQHYFEANLPLVIPVDADLALLQMFGYDAKDRSRDESVSLILRFKGMPKQVVQFGFGNGPYIWVVPTQLVNLDMLKDDLARYAAVAHLISGPRANVLRAPTVELRP